MPFGWVGFCDSETYYEPSKLPECLQCLSAGWGFVTKEPENKTRKRRYKVSNAFRLGGVL